MLQQKERYKRLNMQNPRGLGFQTSKRHITTFTGLNIQPGWRTAMRCPPNKHLQRLITTAEILQGIRSPSSTAKVHLPPQRPVNAGCHCQPTPTKTSLSATCARFHCFIPQLLQVIPSVFQQVCHSDHTYIIHCHQTHTPNLWSCFQQCCAALCSNPMHLSSSAQQGFTAGCCRQLLGPVAAWL